MIWCKMMNENNWSFSKFCQVIRGKDCDVARALCLK